VGRKKTKNFFLFFKRAAQREEKKMEGKNMGRKNKKKDYEKNS